MRLTRVRREAIMPGRAAGFLLPTVLLGFTAGIAMHARNAQQARAADQSLSEEERTRLLAKGKEVFVERCARCHNERTVRQRPPCLLQVAGCAPLLKVIDRRRALAGHFARAWRYLR